LTLLDVTLRIMQLLADNYNNLFYSKSKDLSDDLIQKTSCFTETSKIMFDQISGHCGIAKLTYKINHRNTLISPARAYHLGRHDQLLNVFEMLTDSISGIIVRRCSINP
jgi:hypothetical protein